MQAENFILYLWQNPGIPSHVYNGQLKRALKLQNSAVFVSVGAASCLIRRFDRSVG
jgi:hypothetical protein